MSVGEWKYYRLTGEEGPQGIQGPQGDAGANGTSVTISSTEIRYATSASGTSVPSTGWQATVPTVTQGHFLWTRTTVNYSPNGSTVSYAVARAGADGTKGDTGEQGPQGEKGETGDPGQDATQYYYHVVYVNNTSTGQDYSTTAGSQVYTGTYVDTTLEDAATWALAQTKDIKWNYTKGVKGDTGSQGPTGATGNGISSIAYYYKATTTQTAPGESTVTSTTIPTLSSTNKYLWQKEVITYTNGLGKTTVALIGTYGDTGSQGPQGPKGDDGADGEDGVSISITSETISYASSSSGTSVPSTGWQPTIPTVLQGNYLWTKTYITFNYGDPITSYSVARAGADGATGAKGDTGEQGPQGEKGETGDPGQDATQYYYHVVYVNNTSTGQDYSTTAGSQVYTGTYVDTTLEDAATWALAQTKDIKWNYTKGDTGATGPQGPQGIQGIQGEKGEDGKDLVSGYLGAHATAPTGENGKYYFNTTTHLPYYFTTSWKTLDEAGIDGALRSRIVAEMQKDALEDIPSGSVSSSEWGYFSNVIADEVSADFVKARVMEVDDLRITGNLSSEAITTYDPTPQRLVDSHTFDNVVVGGVLYDRLSEVHEVFGYSPKTYRFVEGTIEWAKVSGAWEATEDEPIELSMTSDYFEFSWDEEVMVLRKSTTYPEYVYNETQEDAVLRYISGLVFVMTESYSESLNFVPKADGQYSLGSINNKWKEIHADTIYGSVEGTITDARDAQYAQKIGKYGSTSAIGSASRPVYVNSSGVITAGNTIPDVSNLATKTELSNGLAGKADINHTEGTYERVIDKDRITFERGLNKAVMSYTSFSSEVDSTTSGTNDKRIQLSVTNGLQYGERAYNSTGDYDLNTWGITPQGVFNGHLSSIDNIDDCEWMSESEILGYLGE